MHKRLMWLVAACIFVTGRVAHAGPSSGLPDELLHPNCGGGEKLRSRIIERIEVLSGRALSPKGLTDRDRTEISRLHTFDDVQRVCRSDGITDALGPDKLREVERRVEALKPDGPGPCRLDAEVRRFTKQDGPGRWPEPICGLIDLQNLRWSFDLDPARRLDALILNRKTAYADDVGQAYLHRIREEIAQTERRSQQIREESAVFARKMNRMREEAAAWAQRMNRIREKEVALQRKIAEDLNRRDCCAKGDYRKRLTPAEESAVVEQRLKNVREENDNYRRRHQEQEMPQAPPTNVPASVREKPIAAEERINVVQEEQRKQDNIKEEQRRERIKDENEAEQRRLDRINAERAKSH